MTTPTFAYTTAEYGWEPEPNSLLGAAAPRWHRRFYLYRQVDDTGISGRGVVALGVEFLDGTVVLRWLGPNPSTVVWRNIADALRVHGHGGHTVAVFLDDDAAERAT